MYPDLPKTRLILDGEDLSEKYGLVLLDGFTIEPPEPKTYTVDIPGGNGSIDLTDFLTGDVAYKDRKASFLLASIYPTDFNVLKSRLLGHIHGKRFDFKITNEPEFTYNGRFKIVKADYALFSGGKVGTIELEAECRPYKNRDRQRYTINAIGGVIAVIPSGRKPVRPTITVPGATIVIYNNKRIELTKGEWEVTDLTLHEGDNEVYFNTYPIHNLKWRDLYNPDLLGHRDITWNEFAQKHLYEWYITNGLGEFIFDRWSDHIEGTWYSDFDGLTWEDLSHLSEESIPDIDDVVVEYEWGDL